MVLDIPAPRRRQEVLLLESAAGGWRCRSDGIEASLLVELAGRRPRPVLVPGSQALVVVDEDGRLAEPLSLGGHPVAATVVDSQTVALGLSRHASGYRFKDRRGYAYIARWGLPASTSRGEVGLRCVRRGDEGWAVGRALAGGCETPTALTSDPRSASIYAACRRGAVSEIRRFAVGSICGEKRP